MKRKHMNEGQIRKSTEFVVFVRGEFGSSKLGEHLSRVFKSFPQIVGVLRL